VTLLCEKEGKEHGRKFYCPYVIENGWIHIDFNIPSKFVFYLKCDKGRDSNSHQVYIQLCYSYVLVLLFFYKVKKIFTFYFSFGIESAFCHMTIVTIGRQQGVNMIFEVCKGGNLAIDDTQQSQKVCMHYKQ